MTPKTPIRIIYDGDCPFCQAYVKMLHLKEQYEVELINAREDHPIIARISQTGLDLDEGMVVELNGELHHGEHAMTMMAMMTADSRSIRGLTKWIFKNAERSRRLYPILRAGRNFTLKLLGHRKIMNLDEI